MGGGDTDINHRSGKALRCVHRHRLHIGAAAHELAGPLAGAVEQDRHGAADGGFVEGDLLGVEQLLERRQPFGHHRFRHLGIVQAGRRRAGAGAVFEGVGLGEADIGDQPQGLREIGVALAGEADDEVRRQRQIGPRPSASGR